MINKILSFKQIPVIKHGNFNIVSEYKIPVKNDTDVFVRVDADYSANHFETKIDDSEFQNIARNGFSIDKNKKLLKNGGMDVWSTKHRNHGFGVVMHLNNIMELFENDLDRIELYSMGSAVLFHGKCKFEPDFRDKDTIEDALYEISLKDYKKFPQIEKSVDKAEEYLNEIAMTGGYHALDSDKIKYAKEIVSEYIEAVNKKKLTPEEKEEYGFASGFDMVLTKEKILENKDFFNGLFKKFNIDYEI